ncbi:hypothetical protein KAJ61_00760 [Candidatus Parcubacteria bacterium]|nr:hypothetical protein [Candidatus Parcubacteria bacterium]
MTFQELLKKCKDDGTVVGILGFDRLPRSATIREVNIDWAVVEFCEDAFDESAPNGSCSVSFSVVVIEH